MTTLNKIREWLKSLDGIDPNVLVTVPFPLPPPTMTPTPSEQPEIDMEADQLNLKIGTLKTCLPNNKNVEELLVIFSELFPKYEINTKERVAAFISQCGHESSDFTKFKENLNYSAKGLQITWPKRFPTPELAQQYQRNPEKIANFVYANRMGNGPVESGDGWRYRGRGAIQLTGKSNYMEFAKFAGMTLDEVVPYLETTKGAVEAACWFWSNRKLNAIADTRDVEALTLKINGGKNGLDDRKARYAKIMAVL